MMDPIMLAVYGVALGMVLGLGLPLTWVVRDTLRREGRWGVNTVEVSCPGCGIQGAKWRMPCSGREALWGGQTCKKCGTSYDKWGKAIVVDLPDAADAA